MLTVSNVNISNSMKGFSYYNASGEVLYNFIDNQRFTSERKDRRFDIGMVANFTDYKDYASYLEVAKKLIELNIVDKAYAVGSGKYLNKYKNDIYSSDYYIDKIIFKGNIVNIESFLQSIAIGFLFSTEEFGEGISNSVLEYMASGVIPIVSDIGASSEIIENGVDGFLVNKYDITSIANIVSNLKNDESYRLRIIENAKKKVTNKFSLRKNIMHLENIYIRAHKS